MSSLPLIMDNGRRGLLGVWRSVLAETLRHSLNRKCLTCPNVQTPKLSLECYSPQSLRSQFHGIGATTVSASSLTAFTGPEVSSERAGIEVTGTSATRHQDTPRHADTDQSRDKWTARARLHSFWDIEHWSLFHESNELRGIFFKSARRRRSKSKPAR